jgi:uncharacterized protein
MSGLLALLDDVAGIAKVAAASVDDVATQAVKAGAKAAGAVIDDAAVTPKYVQGFEAQRELPIIWRIAKGSIRNKLFYLLPAGLLLSAFAPWLIAPLLMLGGGYLCFEGAEKIAHAIAPGHADVPKAAPGPEDPAHLEERRVAGAIKTDFILSAEIMTITLAAIPESTIWLEAATLALVAVGITAIVYGSVALIVKADDFGLLVARKGRIALTRRWGHRLVRAMPGFLRLLTNVGTAAMLWVGGSIIVHGLKELGFAGLGGLIKSWADAMSQLVPAGFGPFVDWTATAALDGVFGLAVGLLLILVATGVTGPLWAMVFEKRSGRNDH